MNDHELLVNIGYLRVEGSAICEVRCSSLKLFVFLAKFKLLLRILQISVIIICTGTPGRRHGDDNLAIDDFVVLFTGFDSTLPISKVSKFCIPAIN